MDKTIRNWGIIGLAASQLYLGAVNAQPIEEYRDAKAELEQKVDEAVKEGKDKVVEWYKKMKSLVEYNENLIKEADVEGDTIYYRNSSKGIYDLPVDPINFRFSTDGKKAKFGICKYTKDEYGETKSRKYIVFEVKYNEKDNSWSYMKDWEWKKDKKDDSAGWMDYLKIASLFAAVGLN
jgi:hypothetical protein